MARIALTVAGFAVGALIGQPELGAMVGSLAGGLLFPTDNKGPRLSDLQVVSSANGIPVAWGYGTFRVGGNVIWCPGLVENSETKKGLSTSTTTYHYYASFAVSFCQGPANIIRIWGDTKIIYEAGGPAYYPSKWFVAGSAPGWAGGICGAFADVDGNLIEAFWVGHGTTVTVPAGASVLQLGINNNYQALSAGGFPVLVSVNGGRETQAYIPAQAVPWEVVGAENAAFPFGNVGGTAPVVVLQNLTAGQSVTIAAEPNGSGGYLGQITINSEAATDAEGRATGNPVQWWGPDGDTHIETGGTMSGPPASIYPAPDIFQGTEDQDVYELIQENEGEDLTPAFRGLCYAGFENFPVANFGNRIPTLRAEVSFSGTSMAQIPNVVQYKNATGCNGNITVTLDRAPTPGNTLIAVALFASPWAVSAGIPTGFELLKSIGNAPYGGGCVVGVAQVTNVGNATAWLFPCSPWPSPYNAGGYGEVSCTIIEILGTPVVAAQAGGAGIEEPHYSTVGLVGGAVDVSGPSLVLSGFASYYDGAIQAGSYTPGALNSPTINFSVAFDGFLSLIGVAGSAPVSGDISASLRSNYVSDGTSAVVYVTITATFPSGGVVVSDGSGSDLAAVVLDVCLRSGLTAEQVDVSRLVGQPVIGYVIGRPTTGAAILKALAGGYFFDAAEIDGRLVFVPRGQSSLMTIPESDLGLADDRAEFEEEMGQEQDLPREMQVIYADPAIDYQQSKQAKRRSGAAVKTKNQSILEVPYALDGDMAAAIAEKGLFLSYLERRKFNLNLWKALYTVLTPTDVVRFVGQGTTEQIRIVKTTEGAGRTIALGAVSEMPAAYLSVASGGATLNYAGGSSASLVVCTLVLFDIPLLQDSDANPGGTGYYFGFVAAAGWSGGVLYVATDNQTFGAENSGGRSLNIGTAASILGAPASPWALDSVNTLTIQGLSGSLASATQAQLIATGINALMVGSELVQFTTATQNTDGSWTVSGLLRGRRGTDAACGSHGSNESVIVLGSGGFTRQALPASVLGALRYYRPVSNGQTVDAVASQDFTIAGRDLMPYSPVSIGGAFDGAQNLILSWTRRTRLGGSYGSGAFALCDGLSGPVSEQSEAYQVDILGAGGAVVRTLSATTASAVYSQAEQVTDFGAVQASYNVKVYQMSAAVGRGFPGAATVPASTTAPVSLPVSGTFYIN